MHSILNSQPRVFLCQIIVVISWLINFSGVYESVVTNRVLAYPAPKGIKANKKFQVKASGKNIHVYDVKVAAADNERRFKAVDDLLNSEKYFDIAAFAYFDLRGETEVTITTDSKITSVKILPISAGISAVFKNNTIQFQLSKPQNFVIEVNGEVVNSLQLFVNPIDEKVPSPIDPNVIFFGPGIHEVSGMVIGDNKTVYIAGGAVIKTTVGKNETYSIEPSGLKNYVPSFELKGKNIKFTGRGIIDASMTPTHGRNLIMISGQGIELTGVILVNSSGWTVPLRKSANVLVKNVKILGYRANSDGIDICNSMNVIVDSCFIRTNDDLVVVKTWEGQGQSNNIVVKNCVLWNQLANALSLGAELRENVDNVLFYNCDIVHNRGRAWCLRIFHTDDARISNIRFEKIRIDEGYQLISLTIGPDIASYNGKYGTISNVIFKEINAIIGELNIDIAGQDDNSLISNIKFEKVMIAKKPLIRHHVKTNGFVRGITVTP